MRRIIILAAIVGALIGWFAPAEADHNPGGVLPIIPNTPAVQQMLRQGYVTWCVDARAAAYPGFVAQLREVTAAAWARTSIVPIEVSFGASCQVQHLMPDIFDCDGCAAYVNYANWPVTVVYNWRLGYSSWRSTQAHEGTNCGHVIGEHEGYDDRAFKSHILQFGSWALPWGGPNVMDVGTHLLAEFSPWGVYECTEADWAVASQWMLPQTFPGGVLVQDGGLNLVFHGPTDAATKRIAVWIETYTGYRFFAGQYAAPSPGGIGGFLLEVPIGPCTAVLLGSENALPASWGRGLQRVGGTACE